MKGYRILLLVLSLGLSSCSDWLDVMPGTSIPQDKLYGKEYGFKDVLTGFYLKMGDEGLYGREMTYKYLDMLGGRYDSKIDEKRENFYEYDNATYRPIKDNIFLGMYNIIANIDDFLAHIDENRSVIKTPRYYELMKGEALALRAYLHFDLLRLFGPIYADDPKGISIPWRKALGKDATPRLPAVTIVENCLADLQLADSLMKDKETDCFFQDESVDAFLRMRQFRMNRWAVKALMARIYCYQGEKAEAYRYAKEVVDCGFFNLTDNVMSPDFFPEHIFSLYIYDLKKLVNPYTFEASSSRNLLGITSENWKLLYETAQLGTSDIRTGDRAFRSGKYDDKSYEVSRKFDQTIYSFGYDASARYGGAESMPLIRLPEMYYILAECEADPIESAKWIDKVRLSRSLSADDALAKEEIRDIYDLPNDSEDGHHTYRQNELMKEYRKEFYGEGQLFYLYKRMKYTTFLLAPEGMDMSKKYRFPIPDDEISFGNNSNIDK